MKRALLIALFVTIAVASTASGWYVLRAELADNPVAQRAGSFSLDTIRVYSASQADSTKRAGIGEGALSAIFVIDFESAASEAYYEQNVQWLLDQYGSNGVRVTHQYVISEDEYRNSEGRFIYAQVAQCAVQTLGSSAPMFIQSLFTTDDPLAAAQAAGVPLCEAAELATDAFLTERGFLYAPSLRVGIAGQSLTTLGANDDHEAIADVVRAKFIDIGVIA